MEEEDLRLQAQRSFLPFVERIWPGFIEGQHHKLVAEAFEEVVFGDCKRLIINIPPRHTKSEFASYALPAWFLGNFPEKKVIQTSHTAELAVGFGRKVRNLVNSEEFRTIFNEIKLQQDSKAAGRWSTNKDRPIWEDPKRWYKEVLGELPKPIEEMPLEEARRLI